MLKRDDLIKKSRNPDYYVGVFWKISCSTTLMQSFIDRVLTGSGFMEGAPPPSTPKVI